MFCIQISGAKVVIHDPVAGSACGCAILSGTKDQVEYAQTLIHAFIYCEKGDT